MKLMLRRLDALEKVLFSEPIVLHMPDGGIYAPPAKGQIAGILRGVYPERKLQTLRSAQSDRPRRAQDDK